MAVEEGIVRKSGSWYTYGEDRLGQGREAAKETLRSNPDLRDEVDVKVRKAAGLLPADESSDKASEVDGPK